MTATTTTFPTPVQQPPANPSLALPLEALCFSSLSVPLPRDHLSRRFYSDAFSVSLRLCALSLSSQSRSHVVPAPTVSLSLARKLADPISTKLHCVSYLHAVTPIYSVRSKLHAALSFPFYLPMHSIFHPHGYDVWRRTSFSLHSRMRKKNLPFRPSRFVSPLERRRRAEIIEKKKQEKKKEKRRPAVLAARDVTSDNTIRKKSEPMKGKKPRTC